MRRVLGLIAVAVLACLPLSAAQQNVIINSIDSEGEVRVKPLPRAELDKHTYKEGEYWTKGSDKLGGFPIEASRAFYEKLFEVVHDNFVVPVKYEDMAGRIIESLDPFTSEVQLTTTDTRILLHTKKLKLLGNFARPAANSPTEWANAIVNIIATLRDSNRELAEMSPERLYHISALYMLKSLDSNAKYSERGVLEDDGATGATTLGITWRRLPFGAQVLSILAGSPISMSQIAEGDAITHVDTMPVSDMTDEEFEAAIGGGGEAITGLNYVSYISGRPGETFVRKNKAEFRSVSVLKKNGIPVVVVHNFKKGSAKEISNALVNVSSDKGIIIDVRAVVNGEGEEAVEAANLFIDGGDIMLTVGADGKPSQAYTAKSGDAANGKPIVVIANNTTRGAAEAFAFILDNKKRAVSVGSPTFGNGNIEQTFDISDGRKASFAVKSIYSMDGYPLSKVGLSPLVCLYYMVSADDITSFLDSVKLGKFQDNRPRIKSPVAPDVERVRAACPASYPFARVSELALDAAASILTEEGAYSQLIEASRAGK
ncbi:MAG: hypothetical protein LBL52_04155 [Rickettsiales bacterium]|nr:hypothetical protein [Rickettsiales bacterium]